jgi:hypothetical protein
METMTTNSGSWLGLLGSVGFVLASYVVKRYIIPFLQIGKRQQYAQFVTVIADEVIDELRQKYPDREWLTHLEEAVTKLAGICGVSTEIAERAVRASAARK